MKRSICYLISLTMLYSCSTAGGIYKSGDAEHGEFSPGRTVLTILGVAAAIAVGKSGGGGGGGPGYAWDYEPGNGQWICRDKSNGQYANHQNCASAPKYDYWP